MLAVTTVTGDTVAIDAEAWHVDDAHGLHLMSVEKKPVATFAATKWISVVKVVK